MAAHPGTHPPAACTVSRLDAARKRNNIYILQWNANGILPHLAELKRLISSQHQQPDIICIQETHLSDKKALKIPGYTTERRDRITHTDRDSGGVATLIRNDLVYSLHNLEPDMEEISIKISMQNQPLNISNIYNVPRKQIDEEKYDKLASRQNVILLGDLNAHSPVFGDTETNREGRSIENIIDKNNLAILNDKTGTHINNDGGLSCIDVTLVSNNLALKSSWKVHHDSLGSDHYPILIHINEPPATENNTTERYALKRADWSSFKEESSKIFKQQQIYNNDSSVYNSNIINAIHQAAKSSIPTVSNKRRTRNVPYWNKRCSEAVRQRQKLQHRMKRTKEIQDCADYRQAKSAAQRTIRLEQKEYWQNYCSSLTTATKLGSVWKMAKNMSGNNSNTSISTLKINGRMYETSQDKSTLIAETIAATSADNNYSSSFQSHRKAHGAKWAQEQQCTS